MSLEELILSDYGTIPKTIGMFLLKCNSSTYLQIQSATKLSDEDLTDGLSLLIQRRIVKFFIFEKVYKYSVLKSMIKRRMYFSVYLSYVSQNYSSKHAKYFSKIMVNGTFKETGENMDSETSTVVDDLINAGILKIEVFSTKTSEMDSCNSSKQFKPSNKFLTVNFSLLDQKIFEEETVKYVSRRYNEAAGSVLKALLKCESGNRDSIIDNLDSTKVLISDKGSLVNERENIDEYLKYLCSANVITQGMDERKSYFFGLPKNTLKAYKLSLIIKDSSMRRIFNMILNKPLVEDKDITIRSLLGINKVKTALLSLQRLGMISQRCIGDYTSGSRIEHSWFVDTSHACLSILKRIEKHICGKLEKINECWTLNYLNEDCMNNYNVWTSDFISLATDHLVLSYGLN
ncbi:uncharacterized protein VICG_01051 [Vittaforma corneae ATCC 50505]|uniref:DNA-directed RNA polymerase III subunit RPC3 n=1 Tax=Vittaforma corneae (strain ATCC 50505) TaxID=993615 RepID=L2GNG9_VITCO|nr:uncharacterized protein VICG_01051 [Vittaforma corneae ATCC 50505]ELA41867.1 hypothetical protein VICG_01051 [Vittaforma corneae ATCC 50505]